jgi:hypothetical protein
MIARAGPSLSRMRKKCKKCKKWIVGLFAAVLLFSDLDNTRVLLASAFQLCRLDDQTGRGVICLTVIALSNAILHPSSLLCLILTLSLTWPFISVIQVE